MNFADFFYSPVTACSIRSPVNDKFLKNIQCECLQDFMVIRIQNPNCYQDSYYYAATNEEPDELSHKNHDIFTFENNMSSSQVKRSPLQWLYDKLLLSQ